MKKLIVTADDFGLSNEVNQAVFQAHTQGILTSASLMISAPAVAEAIAMAKDMPTLGVGLHLTLVEGSSVLPHEEIPDLVDANQKFSNDIVRSGIRYFFSPKIKKQIEKECEAQIKKFLETGLSLDHIDSHNHLHIHPTIANIVIKLAKKYSIPAVRLPLPVNKLLMNVIPAKAGIQISARLQLMVMLPSTLLLRRKLRRSHIKYNDVIFGLSETGAMVEEAWKKIIPQIKEGVTEVYTHPALLTTGILKETMPDYQHQKELSALMSPQIRDQLSKAGIELTSFSALP